MFWYNLYIRTYVLEADKMYKGNVKLTRDEEKNTKSKGIIVMTVIIIALLIIISVFSYKALTKKEIYYKDIEIKSGQTLWEIAESEFGQNIDIRKYVYKIKKINNLKNSNIQPGQIIKIPIEREA